VRHRALTSTEAMIIGIAGAQFDAPPTCSSDVASVSACGM